MVLYKVRTMPKINDWTGITLYSLTFIEKATINYRGRWMWHCSCICGKKLIVEPHQAKRGAIKSCGCQSKTTAKDWTGKKIHKLTFISPTEKRLNSKITWNLQCDCGNYLTSIPYNVVKGSIKACKTCAKESKIYTKDWTGIKQGELTFVQPYSKSKNQAVIWEALCSCGSTCYTIPSNHTKSCGCIGKEFNRKWCSTLGKSGRKYDINTSAARQVYGRYKESGLDFDTFYQLSQCNCYYCGSPPSTKYTYISKYTKMSGEFVYNGLDRVDSKLGHTTDNVVPCCMICNRMKLNYSQETFLSYIERIYSFSLSKRDTSTLNLSIQEVSKSSQ
jgi:hypothetical protein